MAFFTKTEKKAACSKCRATHHRCPHGVDTVKDIHKNAFAGAQRHQMQFINARVRDEMRDDNNNEDDDYIISEIKRKESINSTPYATNTSSISFSSTSASSDTSLTPPSSVTIATIWPLPELPESTSTPPVELKRGRGRPHKDSSEYKMPKKCVKYVKKKDRCQNKSVEEKLNINIPMSSQLLPSGDCSMKNNGQEEEKGKEKKEELKVEEEMLGEGNVKDKEKREQLRQTREEVEEVEEKGREIEEEKDMQVKQESKKQKMSKTEEEDCTKLLEQMDMDAFFAHHNILQNRSLYRDMMKLLHEVDEW
jgi:hypothetical protein